MLGGGPFRTVGEQAFEVVAQLVNGLIEWLEAVIRARQHHGAFHRRQDVPRERRWLDVGGKPAGHVLDQPADGA